MNFEPIFYNALATVLLSDYKKLAELKEKHGTWSLAWKASENTEINPEEQFNRLKTTGVKLVLQDEPEFPEALKEIPLPPLAIYFKGSLPGDKTCISVVGTRKATPEGEEIAYDFSRSLASSGINIVSGLAMGIDSAAHKGALKTGITHAVLATGADNPYPHMNRKLAEDIITGGGGLISEYPPGTVAFPSRFLERNRIVSGLSRAVILIEAPERSGSLATARFALEQNRDIFVVPGPAGHKNYRGSHLLIRAGARLVCSPEEILEDLDLSVKNKSINLAIENIPEEHVILELVRTSGPLTIDEIIEMAELDTSLALRAVSALVLSGKLEEKENGYQAA